MSAPVAIFGATGGVGAAVARKLVNKGQPVVLIGRNEDRLAALSDELDAPSVQCDVTQAEQITAAVDEARGDSGLGGLIYAVGSIVLTPLRRTERSAFIDAFTLNVVGAAEAVQAAAPALQKGGGGVVLFSTVAVDQGFANHAVISAAKGGVQGLTRALAAELAPKVRVNCIAPSLLDTHMAKPLTSNPQMAEGIANMHPIPRLGAADDAAGLAAFLVGDEAGWITGQIIGVDGGRGTLRTKG